MSKRKVPVKVKKLLSHYCNREYRFPVYILIFLLIPLTFTSHSQSINDSVLRKIYPQHYAEAITAKARNLKDRIEGKSRKALASLESAEKKLFQKMLKGKDSLFAKAKLMEITERYGFIRNMPLSKNADSYIPKLDTLITSLSFLESSGIGEKMKNAINQSKALQEQFSRAEFIKEFIKNRKNQLQQYIGKLGLHRNLKRISKTVHYYSAQINEYKEILKDSKKLERKTLELLCQTRLFKDFISKHSGFAKLFPGFGNTVIPGGNQTGFAGLQTRAFLSSSVFNQYGSGISASNSLIGGLQNSIGNAQRIVDNVRNKFSFFGSMEDLDYPDFKPNNQKVKSFKKRLEIGTNFQTQKSNSFFPTTSDVGIALGYKLNDHSVFGVGTSFKIGWGKDIRNISVTGQGLSFRSFGEVRIKNSFFASGGFEMNYQESFNDIRELYSIGPWKKSALVGIMKIISLKTNFFKKTKIQLLYDFLYKETLPITQPVKFRIGYTF